MSRGEQSVRISFVGLGLSGNTAVVTAKLWANGHCDP